MMNVSIATYLFFSTTFYQKKSIHAALDSLCLIVWKLYKGWELLTGSEGVITNDCFYLQKLKMPDLVGN